MQNGQKYESVLWQMEVNVNDRVAYSAHNRYVHSIRGKYKSVVVRFSLFLENAILSKLRTEMVRNMFSH